MTGLLLTGPATCRVELTENGYGDVVVAIAPDIPEDPAIIDSIKVRYFHCLLVFKK
jgi:hypothetical protein